MVVATAILIFSLFIVLANGRNLRRRPTEEERVRLWYERNNTWPPNWQWDSYSEEKKRNVLLREKELQMLPGANERWENWMQHTAHLMVPKFTETGFELKKLPEDLYVKLKAAVDQALANWDNVREEARIDVLYTPIASKFVDIPQLSREVHLRLQALHEEWAGGIKLVPTSIYGIRMNRNGSSLIMHYDKIMTHVISSIVHIAHDYEDENQPWPIEIEDHDGNLHAVNLEGGDMLHYESAACLHGRRKILNGRYYASIFMHYMPAENWNYSIDDVIANVPPHWRDGILEDRGNRWAGQGLTIDSRVSDAAPPRVIRGQQVDNIEEYYSLLEL